MQHDGQPPELVFGARVKALRQEIGIPLQSLAAAVRATTGAAMTARELARLENGERLVRLNEAVALAAIMDMTVEEMLRPLPAPPEQLRRAQEALGRARARMAEATAEYDFAKTRLLRLRDSPAHTNNGDSGEEANPPPADPSAATHDTVTQDITGGSDGLHLAQGQGHAAAG
jgi:transcriptional regulator with XRE-family HTH domain